MMKLRVLAAIGTALLAATATVAQEGDPKEVLSSTPPQNSILVDRIVAIVDEEAILMSDLNAEIETYNFEAKTFGQTLLENPDEIRRKMLDRLIEARLLIAQAKVDGVVLESEVLDRAVAEDLQNLIDRYGSVRALERDLANYNMTMDDFRSRQRELNRMRFYTAQMMRRYIEPKVDIREAEIRDYYEKNRDKIPALPDTVTVLSVQIVPAPDSERRAALDAKMKDVRAALNSGMAFEDVARQYSEGPMAQQGGLLPAFGRGELFDPVLEAQAWELPVGAVSDPITTGRGLHLLQIAERSDDKVTLRQIMFTLELSDEDYDAARIEAQSIAFSAKSGQDLAELARSRAAESAATISAEILGPLAVDTLNPATAQAVEALKPGEVAGPLDAKPSWFVLQLQDRRPGQDLSYDEVEAQLRSVVTQQRMQEELEVFLAQLRTRFYIDIKS